MNLLCSACSAAMSIVWVVMLWIPNLRCEHVKGRLVHLVGIYGDTKENPSFEAVPFALG